MNNAIRATALAAAALLCACSPLPPGTAYEAIQDEVTRAAQPRPVPPRPEAVDRALLQPPPAQAAPALTEPRFDLTVSNAPAAQVLMAIVSGTRYSMLISPNLSGNVSVNLKDVTVREALDTLRELYGYEYKVQGNRIFVEPAGLRTRVFQVNYLSGKRQGLTDVRVTSGSISNASQAPTAGGTVPQPTSVPTPGANGRSGQESSRITTQSDADFWEDLRNSLALIVGSADGRSVILSPHSGVVLVKAFPAEIREVEAFLRATRLTVERQVMLEAKIVEVALRDGYQAGINWAAFRTSANSRLSLGQATPGTVLQTDGPLATGATNIDAATRGFANPTLDALPGQDLVTDPRILGGLFGLAFQTSNFAAILQFLETQGNVQVLSSPRIATLNNQKAVLKVGTDEFFVTSISTQTTTSGTATTTSPTITVQPFFSGIALDVTPQVDENGNIILHIHPSVSAVAEKTKNLNLGTLGSFVLPLAASTVNESDSIVRVTDGHIVAIGGLMKQEQTDDSAQVPGLGDLPGVGVLFRQTSRAFNKRELVILLKPTVIHGEREWNRDLAELQGRLPDYDPRRAAQPRGR